MSDAYVVDAPAKPLLNITFSFKIWHVRRLQESALLTRILVLPTLVTSSGDPWPTRTVNRLTLQIIEATLANQ